MVQAKKFDIALQHLLVPMLVMTFTMFLYFAFQLTQVMGVRDSLNQTLGRQATPYEQSQKLNEQFGGLVLGTKNLAESGNATAKELVAQLIKIGILPDPTKQAAAPAPVPAATEKSEPGPVKP